MSLDASESEWAVRLSGQLKTLCELAESLTYRMLELEERLAGQGDQLTGRQLAAEQRHSAVAQAMEERLRETEERLICIETLLRQEKQHTASQPSLRAVAKPSLLGTHHRFSKNDLPEEGEPLDSLSGEPSFDEDLAMENDCFDQSRAS